MSRQIIEMWAVVTADKKKAGLLIGLVLLAGGMWIRTAFFMGPKNAQASGSRTPSNATPKAQPSSTPDDTDTPEPARIITLTTPPPLKRDLFALSDVLVSLSSQTDRPDVVAPKSARRTDEKHVRSAAMTVEQRVRQEAAALRLRSTMISSNPIAVIETTAGAGKRASVVRMGDSIEGFVLISVRAREVDLEKNGVRVTLSRSPEGSLKEHGG